MKGLLTEIVVNHYWLFIRSYNCSDTMATCTQTQKLRNYHKFYTYKAKIYHNPLISCSSSINYNSHLYNNALHKFLFFPLASSWKYLKSEILVTSWRHTHSIVPLERQKQSPKDLQQQDWIVPFSLLSLPWFWSSILAYFH